MSRNLSPHRPSAVAGLSLVAVIAAAVLVSCVPPPHPDGADPVSSPTAAEAPLVLTDAEARDRYVGAVCPVNEAHTGLAAAYAQGEFTIIQALAAEAATAAEEGAAELGDDALTWDEELYGDVAIVQEGLVTEAAWFAEVAKAPDRSAANAIPFPDLSEAYAASERIRDSLELPEFTDLGSTGSCPE